MDAFPNLTSAENENLVILSEECAELIKECSDVIKAVTKIQRHGFQAQGPDGTIYDNRADLEAEIGQVRNAIQRLIDRGMVSESEITRAQLRKAATIHQYLRHQSN